MTSQPSLCRDVGQSSSRLSIAGLRLGKRKLTGREAVDVCLID